MLRTPIFVVLVTFALLSLHDARATGGSKRHGQLASHDHPISQPLDTGGAITPQLNRDQHVAADVRIVGSARDGYDKASLWINSLIALVGITGVVLSIASFRVAVRASEAASLNAEAVISSERARLYFTVEKRGDGTRPDFFIYVKNFGKLPATKIEIGKEVTAVEDPIRFATEYPPHYSEEPKELYEYLVPDDKCFVAMFRPCLEAKGFSASAARGSDPYAITDIMYGQVTYLDGISPERRHSRYCFIHEHDYDENVGGSLEPAGSADHLECT